MKSGRGLPRSATLARTWSRLGYGRWAGERPRLRAKSQLATYIRAIALNLAWACLVRPVNTIET